MHGKYTFLSYRLVPHVNAAFVWGLQHKYASVARVYPIVTAYIDRVYACHTTHEIDMHTRFLRGKQNVRPSLIDHLCTNTSSRIEKIGLI